MVKKMLEDELKFMNYKDTVKIVADGPKVIRQATFNSIGSEGYTMTVVITGNKADHPLRDFTEAALFECGLFDLTITGPKEKQSEITDFAGEFEEEETEKPKTKGELVDDINTTVLQTNLNEYDESDEIEADNEALEANIFELDNAPKQAYYHRDGKRHKTRAFEEYLAKQL